MQAGLWLCVLLVNSGGVLSAGWAPSRARGQKNTALIFGGVPPVGHINMGVSFFEGTVLGVGFKGNQKENHHFSGVPCFKTHPYPFVGVLSKS